MRTKANVYLSTFKQCAQKEFKVHVFRIEIRAL